MQVFFHINQTTNSQNGKKTIHTKKHPLSPIISLFPSEEKKSHVKHAWKHLRGNSSLHVVLQSKLTASFNNDPALSLHRGVKRGQAHRVGRPYRPHTLSLSVPSFLWQMDVFFYSSRSISFVTKWNNVHFFHSIFCSHPISSPLSNRAFDQGQTGASYLFCSPVEPGRLRGPAAVLLMIKSLERAGGQENAAMSYDHWMLQYHDLYIYQNAYQIILQD